MPCYINATPATHHEARGLAGDTDWLYWPVPYEVVDINISKRIFDRGIADGGVTESEILWAISHDPDKLFAFRPNKENLDADGKFGGTRAIYASALEPYKGTGIEIALRQNLSYQHQLQCLRDRELTYQCFVFHAMRLSRSDIKRRRHLRVNP